MKNTKEKLNNVRNLPHNLSVLQILFKEVLQQMPDEEAKELIDGYERGESIVLVIGQSCYGDNRKTAFGWTLSEDQSWRGLPEPVGTIQ